MSAKRALVLFSGGQDSTVSLAWALERFAHVATIGFDYGQRHAVELEARRAVIAAIKTAFPRWATRLGGDRVIDLSSFGAIGGTALTGEAAIETDGRGLPTTFVPGRNLVFFTYAAALGERLGIETLVGGMCETDYSGYPDCRRATLEALERALALGMDRPIAILTPLMALTKAQTWALAQDLGGERLVEIVIEHTHTCYRGERGRRAAWGYGCGDCPACVLRARGFTAWKAGAA